MGVNYFALNLTFDFATVGVAWYFYKINLLSLKQLLYKFVLNK